MGLHDSLYELFSLRIITEDGGVVWPKSLEKQFILFFVCLCLCVVFTRLVHIIYFFS